MSDWTTLTYVGEWLTLTQAAHALGVDRAGLRELHESGDVDVVRLEGGWRVRNDDVQQMLANRAAGGAA